MVIMLDDGLEDEIDVGKLELQIEALFHKRPEILSVIKTMVRNYNDTKDTNAHLVNYEKYVSRVTHSDYEYRLLIDYYGMKCR